MARLAVVVVTWESERHIEATLRAVGEQLAGDDELLVVDNGSRDGTVTAARAAHERVEVLETGANLGFAPAGNAGAAATSAELLLFLNPDARVQAGCLDALRDAAVTRPDWGAWQALVTLPGGEEVNTSGGVTHFLGFGWAGGCGAPAASVAAEPHDVSFASGAAMVVRRSAWEGAGGFDPAFFMYAEDLDLSLRMRLAGRGVGVVPSARVEHDYDFDKGARKWFLLERNRWRMLVRVYPAPLLALLAPALLGFELALLPVAARGGWLAQKLRAQAAVLRSLPQLLRARRAIQAGARVGASDFAATLTAELDSPYLGAAARLGPLVAGQRAYWRMVRALLR